MRQLVEQIQMDTQEINEVSWRQVAGGAAIAGALMTGTPNIAHAYQDSTYSENKQDIDMGKLLNAIKGVESSGGTDTRTRYEPSVERHLRSTFNHLKPHVQEAIKRYGFKRMATSYGAFQILASTAFDMGFNGDPEGLAEPSENMRFAEKLIRMNMHSFRTHTIEDVVSAYNAGLGNIGKNPGYVSKVMSLYRQG